MSAIQLHDWVDGTGAALPLPDYTMLELICRAIRAHPDTGVALNELRADVCAGAVGETEQQQRAIAFDTAVAFLRKQEALLLVDKYLVFDSAVRWVPRWYLDPAWLLFTDEQKPN